MNHCIEDCCLCSGCLWLHDDYDVFLLHSISKKIVLITSNETTCSSKMLYIIISKIVFSIY